MFFAEERLISIELVIAIAGLIIALAAAITTIWQGVLTRRHNRLSVKPMIRIDRNSITGQPFNITLKNTGVGPAIIKSIQFIVDGKRIPENSQDPGKEVLDALRLETHNFYEIYPNESFAAGEPHIVFESIKPMKSDMEAVKRQETFKRLGIIVNYQSIYEERFTLKDIRPISGT